jgi:FkbM family methyltransferase
MKAKEILYLLGVRPKPKRYGYKIVEFDLPHEGVVQKACWLHPRQVPRPITQEAIDELRRFVKPGDVAIDIGAQAGDMALPLALAAGPTGCVLALEPNPYVFPVLEKHATLNAGKTNLIALPFAATPHDGHFMFEYSDAGYCNGGQHEGISRWRHAHAFRLPVQGRNLPALLAREYPQLAAKVKFVKIDTEGNDHRILRTLVELLKSTRPVIRAEIYKHSNQSQREDFLRFLDELGYRVHWLPCDEQLCGPTLKLDDVMHQQHYDILCVPAAD